MKPVRFEYLRPTSVAAASAALVQMDGAAKLVAGGQSLGPMLNLRLVQPQLLVDIAGIPELSHFEEDIAELRLGACVTAADLEDRRVTSDALPMLAPIAGGIAYRAVRNRGTIGGSLCHADPAADWVSVLPALGATCILTGASGSRRVAAKDFVTAAFETVLAPGEILESITIPRLSTGARWGYEKISRKTGKFAMAIGAVLLDPERGVFRAVVGATNGRPIVVEDARGLFAAHPSDGSAPLDEARLAALLAGIGGDGPLRQLYLAALRRAAAQVFAA